MQRTVAYVHSVWPVCIMFRCMAHVYNALLRNVPLYTIAWQMAFGWLHMGFVSCQVGFSM